MPVRRRGEMRLLRRAEIKFTDMRYVLIALISAAACAAPQAAPPAPPPVRTGVAPAAPAPIRELPSNERSHVNINRYIGSPAQSIVKVSHDVLLTRSIMHAGDPYQPGDPAAVLQYRKDFSLATL